MNATIETGTVTQAARLEALLRASKAISTTADRQHNIEIFLRELHCVASFNYL
jgi:hypothetical protein